MAYGLYQDSQLDYAFGDIFVDGSGSTFRWLWEAVRAGWGVAQVTGRTFIGGFYGNLAGDSQTVPRAELVAIARALAVARKPFRIVSDHLNHVEAIKKGKAWCLDVMGPMRDLWVEVWDLIEGHGGGVGRSLFRLAAVASPSH